MAVKVQGSTIIVEGVKIAFDNVNHANSFLLDYIAAKGNQEETVEAEPKTAESELQELIDKYGAIEIDYVGYSVRSYNVLHRAGVRVVEDVLRLSFEDASMIRNMGKASLREIEQLTNEVVRKQFITWTAEFELPSTIQF